MKRKLLLLITSIFIFCNIFIGCQPGDGYYHYKKEYVDLYTVANNTLLWNSGYVNGADFLYDPVITVIEKDDYGRTMFIYPQRPHVNLEYAALIIMQQSKDGYVYYYPNNCFICEYAEVFLKKPCNVTFDKERIELLKLQNDWGKELDFEKCEKKPISNKRENFPPKGFETDIATALFRNTWCVIIIVSKDQYGRILITLEDKISTYYVAILNPDGTYDLEKGVFTPTDLLNYQDELKAFKELNNWNKPFDETQS